MGKVNMNVIIAKALARNIGARVTMKSTGREGILVGVCMDEYSQDLWDAIVLLDGDDLIDQYDIDEVILLFKKGDYLDDIMFNDEIGFYAKDFNVMFEAGGSTHKHSMKALDFGKLKID